MDMWDVFADYVAERPIVVSAMVGVVLLALVIAVICLIIGLVDKQDGDLTVGAVAAAVFLVAGAILSDGLDGHRTEMLSRLGQSYRVMLDGVEVAREDVCLDLYDTVYDTERQTIYLTRR